MVFCSASCTMKIFMNLDRIRNAYALSLLEHDSLEWPISKGVFKNSIEMLLTRHASCCRATGQHEQADELLQRCIYALEMALHPYFKWGEANCRIPFEEENNRPLFSALFKHMQVCCS